MPRSCWVLAVLVFCSLAIHNAEPVSTTEYNGLKAFYYSTGGPYWTYNPNQNGSAWNFSGSSDPCSWQGVGCACVASTCHVSSLSLTFHNLSGVIPSNISLLSYLNMMELTENHIFSPLPEALADLHQLQYLDLSNNSLLSTLPSWFGNMQPLNVLMLSGNGLLGSIPIALYSLTRLVLLDLSENHLTGSISSNISQLTSLQQLRLYMNHFNGTIPSSLGNCLQLQRLFLDYNELTGTIPVTLTNLKYLQQLVLSSNNISGTIHEEFGTTPALTGLSLQSNELSGTIPATIAHSQLTLLDVAANRMNGTLPSSLFTNLALEHLFLGANSFSGTIPAAAVNLQALKSVGLAGNLFHGSINCSFIGMSNMTYFYIGDNSFTGLLPDVEWSTLYDFNVQGNLFTGTVPHWFASVSLNYFDLGQNLFTATVPETYSRCVVLSFFSMSSNLLTGPAPLMSESLHVAQLFLDNNAFTGTIPLPWTNFVGIAEINVQHNLLSGTLPAGLAQLRSLQIYFVAYNILTGSLDSLVNASAQPYMTNIDVSNNFFTSQLPADAFSIPALQSFSASTNCLSGTLPKEICGATNLTALVLDGLSTATRCRQDVFPHVGLLTAFFLKNRVSGTIPSCVFDLPLLTSVHIAGNGLTGVLPSNLTLAPSLQDVTLSHNRLSGVIPVGLQSRPLQRLDLSFNRFDGELEASFYAVPADGELHLQVNRLSGNIPASFEAASSINILDGNLFRCDSDREDLPRNDPHREAYDCGSDLINLATLLWIAMASLCVLVGAAANLFLASEQGLAVVEVVRARWRAIFRAVAFLHKPDALHVIGQLPQLDTAVAEMLSADADLYSRTVLKALAFLAAIRRLAVLLAVCSFCVLLPVYVALAEIATTYDHTYAWKVSAVLLEGTVASFSLVALLGLASVLFATAVVKITRSLGSSVPVWKRKHKKTYLSLLRVALLSVVNLTVMIVADCAYVYAVLYGASYVVVLMQISMAVFKIAWNEVIMWMLIPLVKRSLGLWAGAPDNTVASPAEPAAATFAAATSRYSLADLRFLALSTLVNNIVLPAVAIACVSSTCFYNALVAAPSVSDSYDIEECTVFLVSPVRGGIDRCVAQQTRHQVVTFDPPFLYSYQCASTVWINYSAVFIFMFAASGAFSPAMKLVLHAIYHSNGGGAERWRAWLRLVLPPRFVEAPGEDSGPVLLLHKEKLVVRVVNYLAIILTFGMVYPPIAVFGAATLVVQSFCEEYVLGFFLAHCTPAQLIRQRRELSRQCAGVAHVFHSVVWQILPVMALMLGFVIFDTSGYTQGWKRGLVSTSVFLAWPFLACCAIIWGESRLAASPAIAEKWTELTRTIRQRSVSLRSLGANWLEGIKDQASNSEPPEGENPGVGEQAAVEVVNPVRTGVDGGQVQIHTGDEH